MELDFIIENEIIVNRTILKNWHDLLEEYGMLYLYAMTGYGKTEQTSLLAKEYYKKWQLISCSQERVVEKVRELKKQWEFLEIESLLIVDDVQDIKGSIAQLELAEELSSKRNSLLKIILLSRAVMPEYLSPLFHAGRMIVEDETPLQLSKDLITEYFKNDTILAQLPKEQLDEVVEICNKMAGGHGLVVNSFCKRLREVSDNIDLVMEQVINDVDGCFDIVLSSQWSEEMRESILSLCLFPQFDLELARKVLGGGAKKILDECVQVSVLLQFHAPDTYEFYKPFRKYLVHNLERCDEAKQERLFTLAGEYYYEERKFEESFRAYQQIKAYDKMKQIIVYLSQNADGCSFARMAIGFLEEMPEDKWKDDVSILGTKAMLSMYQMRIEESNDYIGRLKELSEKKPSSAISKEAFKVYARTKIALPIYPTKEFKNLLYFFSAYVKRENTSLKNIMPTGNLPSFINGGLDLLSLERRKHVLFPVLKQLTELVIGDEAVGVAEGSMGELAFEQGKIDYGMDYLTKALQVSYVRGSIRVQYALVAIQVKILQSNNDSEHAINLLEEFYHKAVKEKFYELLPNIRASMIGCHLLHNTLTTCKEWLEEEAIDERASFYITDRFQLFTKARVYVALRELDEALHIISILEEYACLFKRTYLTIELLILTAIIYYYQSSDWETPLVQAVEMAYPYGLVRVFADQGNALLPLIESLDKERLHIQCKDYLQGIESELKLMATYYTQYLSGE